MLDPINTNVAGVTNPAQTPDGSQTSTLDNLAANIAQGMGVSDEPATDVSTGAPPPATPVPPEPPAAAEPAVEDKDAEAAAKATRLSQDNANLRATLTKMGVDPDSDTAEQLRTGLITVDDLMRARQPVPPTPVSTPTEPKPAAPEVPLDQKLVNLQQTLANQKGDVSAEEYRTTQGQMLEVITGLVQANQNIYQTQESNALQALLDKTLSTTKEVYGSAVTSTVPDDVKDIGESLFVGATDVEVGNLAREVGREKAFTPEGYRHVATKMAPKFDKFVQAIYKMGAQAAVDAINRGGSSGQQVVNPLPPGGGGAPPPPPADKNHFDINNLQANVDAELAATKLVI
jgi:hypothetical protein